MSSLVSFLIYWSRVSHLSLELAKLANLASQLASGSPCLCIPGAGSIGKLPFMWLGLRCYLMIALALGLVEAKGPLNEYISKFSLIVERILGQTQRRPWVLALTGLKLTQENLVFNLQHFNSPQSWLLMQSISLAEFLAEVWSIVS